MNASDGLVYAWRLDGDGGGTQIGWSEIRSWTPEAGGPIWLHIDYSALSTQSLALSRNYRPRWTTFYEFKYPDSGGRK